MNSALNVKMKFILNSLFQVQNAFSVQKSMKPIDDLDASQQLDDYRLKRNKNNESVRKSREKNRAKLQECADKVADLRVENVELNKELTSLQSELYTLKGLFQHCFSFNLNNLAIKPSEIPTATLYKMVMNKDNLQNVTSSSGSLKTSDSAANIAALNMSITNGASKQLENDETDLFYIEQIKNALSSIVKSESSSLTNRMVACSTAELSPMTSTFVSPSTSPGHLNSDMEENHVVNFDLDYDYDSLINESSYMDTKELSTQTSDLVLREHDYTMSK